MYLPKSFALAATAALLLISACDKKESSMPLDQSVPTASSTSVERVPSTLGDWLGTWHGPEGTYLKLTAKPDSKYEVVIADLDGERTFEGLRGSDYIYFERDGIQERITATDGEATGMKWLEGKSKCLTVKEGEGFCRD